MQIRISLPKSDYVLSEPISVTVSISNSTATPIKVPDAIDNRNAWPRYTLTGPACPSGLTFSPRSAETGEDPGENESVEVTRTLAPGEQVDFDLPLDLMARVRQTGDYRLTAELNYGGIAAQAAPVLFHVASPEVESVSAGIDAGLPIGDAWIMWIDRRGSNRRLYQSLHVNHGLAQGGFQPHTITPLQSVGAQATDILSPWANYDRKGAIAFWRVWREGNRLFGWSAMAPKAFIQELGAVPDLVLRPALMPPSGEVDVYAIGHGGKELLVTRFPQVNQEGKSAGPPSLRRIPLPSPAIAGRAVISPPARGNIRRIALTSQSASSLLIEHVDLGSGDGSTVESVSVPNAFALLSSEPGIRIDDNGVSHVAVLFSRDRAARHLGLVEAEFSPDGRPRGAPAAHDLGEFAAPLRAATVQFSLDAKTATACYWIAVLTNEQLAKGSDHEGPETIRPRFRPAFPLELYPLGDGTFVLTVDDHGPHLTFLP